LKKFETLTVEPVTEYVQKVVMDRPSVMNALNTQMMIDLREYFQSLYVDQENLRVIILTGQGTRAFCAGGDLKERNGMSDSVWRQQHAQLEQMVRAIMDCPIPIVASVQGACFGGGLELALTTDFVFASSDATFGFPEGRLGIMPGACGTQNLVRACGLRRAKEIMLTGTPFDAASALDWGIVNRVEAADKLEQSVEAVADEICNTAPISAQQIKQSLNVATQTDLNTGYSFEIAAYNRTVPTQDRREGVAAFNEKRKPGFTGQ